MIRPVCFSATKVHFLWVVKFAVDIKVIGFVLVFHSGYNDVFADKRNFTVIDICFWLEVIFYNLVAVILGIFVTAWCAWAVFNAVDKIIDFIPDFLAKANNYIEKATDKEKNKKEEDKVERRNIKPINKKIKKAKDI